MLLLLPVMEGSECRKTNKGSASLRQEIPGRPAEAHPHAAAALFLG